MMWGGLLLLVLSLFTEQVNLESILTVQAVNSLFYLIVMGSMVGHSLYYWLIARTNPVFPSTWLYISPLIALGIGVFLYNEKVTWITALGVITIITGTVLVNLDTLKQLMRKPEKTNPLLKKYS
jgi:drug/metabolite transporter (DMT)-like permease